MKNYLEWLAQDTPTKWWHDSAIPAEIDAAIANGALGVTTNPVLTYKSLQAVPDFWKPEVDRIPGDLAPALRAEELLRIIARYAASRLKGIYERTEGRHGYALGQLDPSICSDSDRMLEQALRYASWGENIAVKVPTVKAALPVIEELAAKGIAVCTTLNFSVSQALAAGEAYERGAARARAAGIPVRPCFAVQQGGRLDEYLWEVAQDNRIDVPPEDFQKAGNAVCKKSYRLFRERASPRRSCPPGCVGSTTSPPWPAPTWCSRCRRGSRGWPSRWTCRRRADRRGGPGGGHREAAQDPRVREGVRRGRTGPGGLRDLRRHAEDALPVPLDGLGSARDLRMDGPVRAMVLKQKDLAPLQGGSADAAATLTQGP